MKQYRKKRIGLRYRKQSKSYFPKKTAYQRKEEVTSEDFYERAGIWAEFGKIICISVAYFTNNKQERNLRVTSFSGDNEKQILLDFKKLLDTHFNKSYHVLCAHNGKEFVGEYTADPDLFPEDNQLKINFGDV